MNKITTNQSKKVSVIIPVYGAEKFVSQTIESVLNQTYQNWEIIIVDDGSPDKSIEICQQFTDPRIRIVRQANRGLPGARNTGIRHARGEYLALLDADDIWLPTKLEQHVAHLESSPQIGISFSYSAFIDEESNELGIYQMPRLLQDITPAYILCRNPIGNGSSGVMRREVFEQIRYEDNLYGKVEDFYFDERLRKANADATDVECWLRISLTTNLTIEGIPEALTLYRVNSGGLSANLHKQLEALERVMDKTRKYAPKVIQECENLSRAYHLRYACRRAVTLGSANDAVKLANQAIASDWRIILEEPIRTGITIAAAYMLLLLPKRLYKQFENLALKMTGASQRNRLQTQS